MSILQSNAELLLLLKSIREIKVLGKSNLNGNPVLRLKTRSQTCVGGISHLSLVNWTLDLKNQ